MRPGALPDTPETPFCSQITENYMTAPTLAKIALLLLASPLALAQTPGRTLQSAQLNGNQLEITTSDGLYVIKPYSSRIVETTFIPQGERFNPASHAVVLAPGKDAA